MIDIELALKHKIQATLKDYHVLENDIEGAVCKKYNIDYRIEILGIYDYDSNSTGERVLIGVYQKYNNLSSRNLKRFELTYDELIDYMRKDRKTDMTQYIVIGTFQDTNEDVVLGCFDTEQEALQFAKSPDLRGYPEALGNPSCIHIYKQKG